MTFAWWHGVIALIPILPNFWSIWDIWNHDFRPPERRMYWLLAAVFLPVIGGLLYIFIGRKQAILPE